MGWEGNQSLWESCINSEPTVWVEVWGIATGIKAMNINIYFGAQDLGLFSGSCLYFKECRLSGKWYVPVLLKKLKRFFFSSFLLLQRWKIESYWETDFSEVERQTFLISWKSILNWASSWESDPSMTNQLSLKSTGQQCSCHLRPTHRILGSQGFDSRGCHPSLTAHAEASGRADFYILCNWTEWPLRCITVLRWNHFDF